MKMNLLKLFTLILSCALWLTTIAEQLQVRCDTVYSAMKPLTLDQATALLTAIDQSELQPSVNDKNQVESRFHMGMGCEWYANTDNNSGTALEHGKPVNLGMGDRILVDVSVEGAAKELALMPGSNFPLRQQDKVIVLALTANQKAAVFSPLYQYADHKFIPTGGPVNYPAADARARDFAARFYKQPITLQAGKGTFSQNDETVLSWEIDGFVAAKPEWTLDNWSSTGNFHTAKGLVKIQCTGGWLGRTSQEPGFSATVHNGPLADLDITNLWAGELNSDCVYEW